MRHFGKSIIYNLIYVNGEAVPFIEQEAGQGVIATDDPAIIDALETRIRERRGGIWEMTLDQYDEVLKKNSVVNSKPQSQRRLESVVRGGMSLAEAQLMVSRHDTVVAPVAAEAKKPVPTVAAESNAPISAEVNVSRPTVGKVKR